MKKYMKVQNGELIKFHNFGQYIIDKFISDKKRISYPREMSIAKKLAVISTSQEFWETVPENKVDSLAYFIKKENLAIIKYLHEEFQKQKWIQFNESKKNTLDFSKETVKLSNDKIGEDLKLVRKLTSIKDFLKYG